MDIEEDKADIHSTKPIETNYSSSTTTSNVASERNKLIIFGLSKLKKTDAKFLSKMTDLDIDLSKCTINSQDVEEVLPILRNCPHLDSLRLKLPKNKTPSDLKFKLYELIEQNSTITALSIHENESQMLRGEVKKLSEVVNRLPNIRQIELSLKRTLLTT